MDALAGLALFDELSDAVIGVTDEGLYVYANPAAHQVFGVDKLVGRNGIEFRSPRTKARAADQLRRFRRDGHIAGENEIRSPDGRLTLVRFRGTADYRPGVHLLVITALAPGSAERQVGRIGRGAARAQLFRAMFETDPTAVLVLDDDRRNVDGNRVARSFLGVSREDLRRRRVDDFASSSVRENLDRLWQVFLTRGSLEGLLPMLLTNGLQRTVSFQARARVTPGRHVINFKLAHPDHQTTELVLEDGDKVTNLTTREREVLTLLARGASAETIATYAVLSPETVRTHVRNAMRKLGARSRPHAIALAIRLREIDP
jgi:DNA-binding CsgD family transcriptional regulator